MLPLYILSAAAYAAIVYGKIFSYHYPDLNFEPLVPGSSLQADYYYTIKKYAKEMNLPEEKTNIIYQMTTPHLFNYRVYYSNLFVGNPLQLIIVAIFDTGSPQTWVASGNCTSGAGSMCVPGKQFYYSGNSTTFEPDQRPYGVSYIGGDVSGYYSRDTVRFAGMTVRNHTFIEIQTAGPGIVGMPGISGIVGLAFPPAEADRISYLPDRLFTENNIPKIFSFYYKSIPAITGNEQGKITFGGYNSSHFAEEPTYIPVTVPSYWSLQLDNTDYANRKIPSTSMKAIVDTGTSLLYCPYEISKIIERYVGVNVTDNYRLPCERLANLPDLVLRLGPNKKTFNLKPSEYVFQDPSGRCELGIRGLPQGYGDSMWILGAVFIRAYACIFDLENQRIGIGHSA